MAFLDHTLYEALPYGFMVLGLVLTYRYLRIIDLTFAASFSLSTAILARMLVGGSDWRLAVCAAFGSAILVTAFTVALVFVLKVESLLAGLIASFAGYAIALMFTRGSLALPHSTNPLAPLKAFDRPFLWETSPLHPSQILLFGFLLCLAALAVNVFLRSEAGLAFRAIEDERSSTNVLASIGVSTERVSAAGMLAANVLASSTGILVVLKEGQATAQRGFDAVLTGIAAYLLGVTLFEARPREPKPKRGLGTDLITRAQLFSPTGAALAGVVLYFLVLKAVSYLNVPSSVPKLVLVALLVGAITVSRWPKLRSAWDVRRSDRTEWVGHAEHLKCQKVSVSYPGYPVPTEVLTSASLEIGPGELVHLRGDNGSGKSTLLRYLAGEIPGTGHVRLPGSEGKASRQGRRAGVALVRQDASLGSPSVLTVQEYLALVATGDRASPLRRGRSRTIPEAARTATRPFQAELVGHLSGGQRQVLNIASLLARSSPPRVVLFDEPLTHLDEPNASRCVELIQALKERGHCLALVQHDVPLAPVADDNGHQPSRARLAQLVTRSIEIGEIDEGRGVSSAGDNCRPARGVAIA